MDSDIDYVSLSSETNITSQWSGFDVPRELQIFMTSLYVITFVIALLGNNLVIHAVVQYQHMHTATNVLIANMAVADLITTLFAMPYSVVYLFVQGRWFGGVFGSLSCKTVHFVIAVTIAASIVALFLVSLERFCAVVYPLKFFPVIHNKKLLTVIVWGVSAVLMIVYLVVYRVSLYNDKMYLCQLVWEPEFNENGSPKTFYLLVFLFLYLIPLSAIAIMHTFIVRRLWRREVPGNRLELNRRAALRSRRSVVKMLAVVLVVFSVCWLPLHVMHIYINFHYNKFKMLSPWIVMLLFWASHANSAINPYIFITMNQRFNKIVRGLFTRCRTCAFNATLSRQLSTTGMVKSRFLFSEFQGYSLADSSAKSPESPRVHLKHFTSLTNLDVPASPMLYHRNASRESTL